MAERKLAGLVPESWVGRPARELVYWTKTVRYEILISQSEGWLPVFCEALGLGEAWGWKFERTCYFQPADCDTPKEQWEIFLPREIFVDVVASLQICWYMAVIGEFAVTDGERFDGDPALWQEFHNGESWEDSHPQPTLSFSSGYCR